MNQFKVKMGAVCALALATGLAEAKVEFGTPFADGMVLQRGMKVPVWGTAKAGEKVRVCFADQSATATADAAGRWRADLAPLAASKEGRVLRAVNSADAADVAEAKDVLVGEVWYCSGQSNTELPLCGSNPHFRDRKGALRAMMTHKPLVRFCYASNYRWSAEPKAKAAYPVQWKTFTPANLMGPHSFSAMGVYFALELHHALDVPVGIVGSYWGGTRIEPWTPAEGFALAGLDLAREPRDEKRLHQNPCVLWNEMVAPWAPMAMKGFIWYQGCSNAAEHTRYADMMHALYNGWAKAFENAELKLCFVQLTPWGSPVIPHIQEAQAKFAREEKNARMAVINDVGNLRDIHPFDKETVGQRLAALALAHDYGFSALKADAPAFRAWRAEGAKAIVACDHVESWYLYNPDWSLANGFELAGADGVFKPAKIENLTLRKNREGKLIGGSNGVISGKELVLTAEGVSEPKKIRYLHSSPWYGGLYNEANLPLGAFHAE